MLTSSNHKFDLLQNLRLRADITVKTKDQLFGLKLWQRKWRVVVGVYNDPVSENNGLYILKYGKSSEVLWDNDNWQKLEVEEYIQLQTDWDEVDTLSPAYLLNKPTSLSSFTNDPGYVTETWVEAKNYLTELPDHDLVAAHHTASGLTTGHFLKALTPTTYGFVAHGLTASDVGALPVALPSGQIFIGNSSNVATARTLTLNATPGTFNLSSLGGLTMPNASGTVRGLLSAAHWTLFNNKQEALTNSTSNTISGTQVQRAALTGDVSASANNNSVTVTGIRNKSITLATGYLRYTGSAWEFKNETYLTSTDLSGYATELWVENQNYINSVAHTHGISNSAGDSQFTFADGESIRFEGSGSTTVSFSPLTKKVIISSVAGASKWTDINNDIYRDSKVRIGDTTAPDHDLDVTGTFGLQDTTSSTVGVIYKGSDRFIHNYGTGGVYVGSNAGNFSLSGSYNTAMGVDALTAISSGASNVVVGYQAMDAATTTAKNVAIGSEAFGNIITGNDNIAIGYFAGYYNSAYQSVTSGSQCIYIGSQARPSSSSPLNEIVIGGNLNTGKGDNTVRIGNSNTDATYLDGVVMLDRYTTVGSPTASSYEGGLIYNTTTDIVQYSNGTAWVDVGGGGGASGLEIDNKGTSTTLQFDTDDDKLYIVSASGDRTIYINNAAATRAKTLMIHLSSSTTTNRNITWYYGTSGTTAIPDECWQDSVPLSIANGDYNYLITINNIGTGSANLRISFVRMPK